MEDAALIGEELYVANDRKCNDCISGLKGNEQVQVSVRVEAVEALSRGHRSRGAVDTSVISDITGSNFFGVGTSHVLVPYKFGNSVGPAQTYGIQDTHSADSTLSPDVAAAMLKIVEAYQSGV
jgi:hypothetical protein